MFMIAIFYLRQTILHSTKAFNYSHTKFHFASVKDSNFAENFKSAGWGLRPNTPGDIYFGLNSGFDPRDIVYSGSNLNREEMEQFLNWGVTTLNLDSISQLRFLCEVFCLTQSRRVRESQRERGVTSWVGVECF